MTRKLLLTGVAILVASATIALVWVHPGQADGRADHEQSADSQDRFPGHVAGTSNFERADCIAANSGTVGA